jgi:hypothetical protein
MTVTCTDSTTGQQTTSDDCPAADVLTVLWQTAVVGGVIAGLYIWATGEGVVKGNAGARAAKYLATRAHDYAFGR